MLHSNRHDWLYMLVSLPHYRPSLLLPTDEQQVGMLFVEKRARSASTSTPLPPKKYKSVTPLLASRKDLQASPTHTATDFSVDPTP